MASKRKKPAKKTKAQIAATKKQTATALEAAANAEVIEPTLGDTEDVRERVDGTPDQRSDAQRRAAEYQEIIQREGARLRCRVVPVLNPRIRMIDGERGNEGIVTAGVSVEPLV